MERHQRDVVRREFAGQATAFEDPQRPFGRADVVDWILANSPARATDVLVDVAAGTALVGRAFAARVRLVVAVDLSREMLVQGKRAAAAARIDNIVFHEADATAMPATTASAHRIVCRLAIHHYEDPMLPLREMVRVCRPGGTVTIIDMVVPDPSTAMLFNDLERRRDPSHTNALTKHELHAAIEAAGATITHTARRENVLASGPWLDQTSTSDRDRRAIVSAWEAELAGGPATGMRPRRTDHGFELVHEWELVVGAVGAAAAG